jgi:hypothetical protein
MKILSVFLLCGLCGALALPLPLPVLLPAVEKPVLECDGCKWLVGKMQTYLRTNEDRFSNATDNALEQNICAHLPDNATAFCDQLVEKYVPFALSSFVEKILDPHFVCTEVVPLCSETAIFQNPENRVKNPKTIETCVTTFTMVYHSQNASLTNQIFTECKRAYPNKVLECEVVSMHVSTTVESLSNAVCESYIF